MNLSIMAGIIASIGTSIVVLTQSQSPYTLQVSDSGKILAPATTAEFSIIVPSGLSSSFRCNIAPTGLYPTSLSESGSAVSNNGYRISNANKMANSVVMPNATATLIASSSDVLALGGTVGQWRSVGGVIPGLNNTNIGGAAYISSYTQGYVSGGSGIGTRLKGIKFRYDHMYGQAGAEVIPAYSVDVGFSLEYPIGTTPVKALFGGVDQATCTNGTPTVISDYMPVDIPLGALIGVHSGQHSGSSANPCLSGTGSGVQNVGDVHIVNASDGTAWKTNLTVIGSSLTSGGIATSKLTSPSIFRPSEIIGITDTGATVVWAGASSRQEPSNGDFQSVVGGFTGEIGRILGGNYAISNKGIASTQLGQLNNSTQGAIRRNHMQYCTVIAVDGWPNDLGTGANSIKTHMTQLVTWPESTGKELWVRTTSPETASTDHMSSIAGQTAITLSLSQIIDSLNADLVATKWSGTVNRVIDARPYVEGGTSSDGTRVWRVAAGARTVTDGVMTTGSNVLTSATANFTNDDTGHYVYVPSAGIAGRAVMTYVSPTTVTLTTYVLGAVYNATSNSSGMTCYIQCNEAVADDGIHGTKRQGEYEQANAASMQPV